ncbi:hypothetical protein DL96DRAFT_1678138 [Flagelloscypha sp. PMI_526]|nr:hypothetical protein DL96DRAFT_1678138 [Flagelloscypha sp. PMI_526]
MARTWIFFSDLTPDIARTIVEFAAHDFKTAQALLLTSKVLSQWTIPLFYKGVYLPKENSAAKFLAALDASLDSPFPPRGQHVRNLIVYAYNDPELGRDLLPDILAHTTGLKSFTWQCKGEVIPFPDTLPMSLKRLNIHFLVFDETSCPVDAFMLDGASGIEQLQVATRYEPDAGYSILQSFRFAHFTSLKYLYLRSRNVYGATSVDLVAHIRGVIIPQFPPTLKACVLHDFVWRGRNENGGALTNDMKELIMGDIDDRIILSVDVELRLSCKAPYWDFLLKTSKNNPLLCQPWSDKEYTWEEIETLIEKRKHLRELWRGEFPRSETKFMVTDYPGNVNPEDWALIAIFGIPFLIYWAGETVWKKIRH